MQDEDAEQTDERLFFFAETSPAIEPKPDNKKKKVNPNAGHRDRLRERFAKAGMDGVADYELLEMILYRSLPRIDTKPIAKDLLLRFGSFGDVLSADIQRLEEVKGIKHATALDLKIVAAAAKELLKSGVQSRELLSSWASVLEYCTAAMAYESKSSSGFCFWIRRMG